MSEKFTASNGLTLSIYEDGIIWEGGTRPRKYTEALREFFLHERDEELGRWRWPEDPGFVVYQACDDRVLVVDEEAGNSKPFRRFRSVFLNSGYAGAARAYFLAHPESKPWHDAKPGECWRFEMKNGRVHGGVINTDRYLHSIDSEGENLYVHIESPMIVAGRKIWPEVSDEC